MPLTGAQSARCMVFDHKGLMWIGTEQGLLRYDGYRLNNYRNTVYESGALPNNYVRTLTVDGRDCLWVGTRDGLVCYDQRHGSAKTYHLQGNNRRQINVLYTAHDGAVWAGVEAGAARYDEKRDSFVYYDFPAPALSFAEDSKGRLYVGTWEKGLFLLDWQKGQHQAYPSLGGRNTAFSLLADSWGRLWVGSWENGIVRLDHPQDIKSPGMAHFNEGRADFRTIYRLVEDAASQSVWACCMEGITRVGIGQQAEVENYPIDSYFCNDIHADGQGNILVLTQNDGIHRLSTQPYPFRLNPLPAEGRQLAVDCISQMFTSDGRYFWLGLHPYGLALYDRSTQQVRYGTAIPGFERMNDDVDVHRQTIHSFIQVGDELWMGSSKGVIVWKGGKPAELLNPQNVSFLRGSGINALLRQRNGMIWMGQEAQLNLAFSKQKGQGLEMREGDDVFSECDVRGLTEDAEGHVWIATDNRGIIRASGDSRNPNFLRFHRYCPDNGGYPVNDAIACFEDTHHRLWSISSGSGLFLYNKEEDAFMPVSRRYHIDGESVYSIDEDAEGSLWLTTDRALVRLTWQDEEEPLVTNFGPADGLKGLHFSPTATCKYGKELFIGSQDAFFSFEPNARLGHVGNQEAQLIVTDLLIGDQPISQIDKRLRESITSEAPTFAQHLVIPASVDKFSVEFALPTYINQKLCRYAYCLEGYSNNWYFVSPQQRQATFQNLPSGYYTLHLKAYDSYGHCVMLPYTIAIRILPPWYLSWWAFLIYFVLLGLAVYGTVAWYRNRLHRKSQLQQRVNELIHYRDLMLMKQFNDQQALKAEEAQHNTTDEQFIQKAIDCVKAHLDDGDYDREQFARDMLISSSTLYNKLRALTGQNVTAFISSVRLKEACRIARQQPSISVSELSMRVGFNTPKYFTKCFKKEFGELPSEYLERLKQ